MTKDGYPLRTLISGRLIDVAPVVTPAYPAATVGLRSLAKKMDAPLHEVIALSKSGDLKKLLARSDARAAQEHLAKRGPQPTMTGAAAVVHTLNKRPSI